jgi:hypothetical protein
LYTGRTFCSKLVKIDGNDVWFVNRSGILIMNKIDQIKRVYALDAEEKPSDEIDVQEAEERSMLRLPRGV